MNCDVIKPYIPIECGKLPNKVTVLQLKTYVYEVVNGKRKRVSPLVFAEDGKTVIKIIERGVISRHSI